MIIIALGANLPSRCGSPEQTIEAAYDALRAKGVFVKKRSSIWRSAPVPMSDQPFYKNSVISVESALDVFALLKVLKDIERDLGRQSDVRNAARVIDLDIISYNDQQIDEGRLSVPHPRAHERSFVLYPLQEIAPDWQHPVSGTAISVLIKALGEGCNIEKLEVLS